MAVVVHAVHTGTALCAYGILVTHKAPSNLAWAGHARAKASSVGRTRERRCVTQRVEARGADIGLVLVQARKQWNEPSGVHLGAGRGAQPINVIHTAPTTDKGEVSRATRQHEHLTTTHQTDREHKGTQRRLPFVSTNPLTRRRPPAFGGHGRRGSPAHQWPPGRQ